MRSAGHTVQSERLAHGPGRACNPVATRAILAIRRDRSRHLAACAGIGRSHSARTAVIARPCPDRLAMKPRYQVVIIGGGPVGVALAVELGQRGIACALIERRREPQRIPKGQNLTQRAVEHFYFWGVLDALRAARILPPEYPMSGIVAYRDLNNKFWAAPPLREIVNPYYFQNNERLPQYQGEQVLRARLAQLDNVEARFGWAAESIAQDAGGVAVDIAEDGGAGRETLQADYAVGC